MRQHHQDGGHKIDAFEEVCIQRKEGFLNDKASIVVFREADSTKAFLSQCEIYACGEDNLTADLEFICKDGAVSAHQFILASHSQFICQILNRFTCLFTSLFFATRTIVKVSRPGVQRVRLELRPDVPPGQAERRRDGAGESELVGCQT